MKKIHLLRTEKKGAPRETTRGQLSSERGRRKATCQKQNDLRISIMVLIFITFLIFPVFLIVIVAASEIRCSLAGSL